MTPRAYEAYVQELISNLAPFRGVEVHRNRKFCGVRQPGEYEVDVALEFTIDNKLRFLLIVECKRWNKPVGRDVIQRLVQTRDAIAAHKAVACSPIGFTKEAIDVAKAHGIALWVIAAKRKQRSRPIWRTVQCCVDFRAMEADQVNRRLWRELMEMLTWSVAGSAVPSTWSVRDFSKVAEAVPGQFDQLAEACGFPSAKFYFFHDGDPFSDEGLAAHQIFKEIIGVARSGLPPEDALRVRIEESFQRAHHEIRSIYDPTRREREEVARKAARERERSSFRFIHSLTETQEKVLVAIAMSNGPLGRKELEPLVTASSSSVGAALISLRKKEMVTELSDGENTRYSTSVRPEELK